MFMLSLYHSDSVIYLFIQRKSANTSHQKPLIISILMIDIF